MPGKKTSKSPPKGRGKTKVLTRAAEKKKISETNPERFLSKYGVVSKKRKKK